MNSKHLIRAGLSSLVALCLVLGACSEGDDPTAPAPVPADLETFFATMPAWETYSPPQPDADTPLGDAETEEVEIDGEPYEETTTPYSITRTPEKLVTLNPDVEVLWVGALLQGDGYVGGIGSLQELPVRQRAPLTVSLDLLTGDNTREVEGPDPASVNQAIGELIQAATDAGHTAGSDIYYTKETTHSFDQASLKMGLSASYMGASIKGSLEAGMSSEMRTVTAYFVQNMFTASMVLPQTPESVFSEDFSEDHLAEQVDRGRMGPDNPPVFVSSITYGRVLIFTFTSTALESEIKSTLNAVYNAGQFGGELTAEQESILEHAEISVVTVGGDAEHALSLIRSNDLSAYFSSDAPLTSARPISYTVRNLADNTIARVSETTEYDLREYTPAEQVVTGGVYRIKFFRVRGEDFYWIDPHAVNPIWDWNNAEIYYTFDVTDALGRQTALEYESALGHLYAERLSEDELFNLVNTSGAPAAWVEVRVHYDGRDQVKIEGEFWDYDDLDPSDRFAVYNLTYRWPASPLPVGVHQTVRGDSWGDTIRLYWEVQKVDDLFD